jgi:hypothetical protein
MVVFDVNKCEKCNYACISILFQHNFINWTSGSDDVDKFIQSTQLSAHNKVSDALEWIPYDRFYDIRYIAKGKINKMYRANWIDGYIGYWNNKDDNQYWERMEPNMFVILKILNNPASITLNFINKV